MAVSERAEESPPPVTAAPVVLPRYSWSGIAGALAPSAVFLGVRAVGLLMLAWQSWANGDRLSTRLTLWDGQWLLGIADGGYGSVPHGLVDAYGHRDATTALAFFPGYPFTVSVLRFVTGAGLVFTGLLVALVAGLVLAHGLARLGELVPGGSRRVGLLLVGLVAAAPMGVVWSMAYSEGLFCACAVWALVAVLREDWVRAGWCTTLAGLVRPTGFALLAGVGLAALVEVYARRGALRDGGWRVWLGGAIAPLGLLGYLSFVAARTGSLTGWFALQRHGWNSRFDGGMSTLRFSADVLATGRSVLEVATVVVLAGAVALWVLCVCRSPDAPVSGWVPRVPWPLNVYAAGVLAMDLCSNGLMNSKARLLLPAFTLLAPVAVGLARRHGRTQLAMLTALALVSAWFGGYALTGWPYAI